MKVLQKLAERGNAVAVIEQNLEVIKEDNYIIDVGPEEGTAGRHICTQGNPWEIIKERQRSSTARFLNDYLSQ